MFENYVWWAQTMSYLSYAYYFGIDQEKHCKEGNLNDRYVIKVAKRKLNYSLNLFSLLTTEANDSNLEITTDIVKVKKIKSEREATHPARYHSFKVDFLLKTRIWKI